MVPERPEAADECSERDFGRRGIEPPSLPPPRRAAAERRPHQQTEVERAGMDEKSFEDALVTPQVRPPHPAGVIEMREGALDKLPTLAHQLSTAGSAGASTTAIDGRLGLGHRRPGPTAAIGFRDVTAQPQRVQIDQNLIAVITRRSAMISANAIGAAAAPSCSAAMIAVSLRLVVSPTSAPCRVTATSAPVSRSTACSALWAGCASS